MKLIKISFCTVLTLACFHSGFVFCAAAKSSAAGTAVKSPYSITMASSEQLSTNLHAADFTYFAEQTKIHQKLGGKTIEAAALLKQIESSLQEYKQCAGPLVAKLTDKNQLLGALLKDNQAGFGALSRHAIENMSKAKQNKEGSNKTSN